MLNDDICANVSAALAEDLGGTVDPSSDLTAQLIPADKECAAVIITREGGIFCGQAWAQEVYRQLGEGKVELEFLTKDGDEIKPGQEIVRLKGNARLLLTGERTALNFMQTMSGIATTVRTYAQAIAGTACKLLDTRKTLPGLRAASKYAVTCGGGLNHRQGLFDMYLIKENHIIACGSIAKAIAKARALQPEARVEVEVRDLNELNQALEAQADIIMLDNFEYEDMEKAVTINQHRAKLEISGNVTIETIARYAASGVDYISVGALTKNIRALDFSLRFLDNCQETVNSAATSQKA